MLNRLLTAALLLSFSAQAHALLVVDGNHVADTRTGLTWLNLDQTLGQSFDAITERLTSGDLMRYRQATNPEFRSLFADSAGFHRQGTTEYTGPDGLITDPPNLLELLALSAAFAEAFVGAPGPNGSEILMGFLPDRFPTDFTGGGLYIPGAAHLLSFNDEDPWHSQTNVGYPDIGAWLVLSPVPEASTWLLVLLGLLAVYVNSWAPISGVPPTRVVRKKS